MVNGPDAIGEFREVLDQDPICSCTDPLVQDPIGSFTDPPVSTPVTEPESIGSYHTDEVMPLPMAPTRLASDRQAAPISAVTSGFIWSCVRT